jgi:hypothetical protein
MKPFSNLQEDLRKWFSKTDPEGDWKRINSKGEAIGPCAREPGEPKPKCMSAEKRASLTKKERASAVRAKRKHDPNPERKGEPINVSNFGKGKISENMENLNEKNEPTNPELWSRAKALARSKFDVYPSAYANGWASKWYKGKGGGWKTVSEDSEVKSNLKTFKQISELVKPDVKNDLNSLDKISFVKKHGLTKSVARQKLTTEAKEKTEYDYEGDMARGQLQSIISNAQRVHDMLKDDTNIAEWVQSKITLAEDYISTVANYMMSELDEATSARARLADAMKKAQEQREREERAGAALLNPKPKNEEVMVEREDDEYHTPSKHHVQVQVSKGDGPKTHRKATVRAKEPKHAVSAAIAHYKQQGYTVHDHKYLGESFADTMAHKDMANAAKESGDTHAFHGHMVDHHVSMANFHKEHGDDKSAKEHEGKAKEHHSNMERYYREDIEHIDEKISVVQGQAPRQQGRFAPNNQIRTDKTSIGRVVSGTQYTGTRKPKPKNEETVQEGRASQRHPLEGHEYHKKSDEALVHIAKDAHAAAEAMKSHNTTAENKYRDQANDSATVRHFRKTSGMPDWYKKKYGHVKEGVVNEVMDEPNYKNSIQARQKKADDANKPPFDGPYTTGPSTVTDKSGAKHSPMSRVRDLARAAAKRQAQKMPVKEGLEESRKAEIVKEIMKKGKKKEDNSFQAEPVIGSTVVKADN